MIFALGLLTMGLLMLLFLPALWRRATRLATRRLEMRMPLSMSEIVAERDQLRAEFAAERRKLEQRSERLSANLAEARADLGERSVRTVQLDDMLKETRADLEHARGQIDILERQANEIDLERFALEKSYYDSEGMLHRRTAQLENLSGRFAQLQQISDERRALIGSLQTRVEGLEIELESALKKLDTTQKDLTEKISIAQFLERERDQFRSDSVSARNRREQLQQNVAAQQRQIESLDAALRTARRECAKIDEEIDHLKTQLSESSGREERLRQEIKAQSAADETTRKAEAEREEAHKAAIASLQGALDAARRDGQTLRSELAELRRSVVRANSGSPADHLEQTSPDGDMLILRRAIADLGSEIIRVASSANQGSARQRGSASDGANELSEKIRDLRDRVQPAAGE